MAPEPPLLTPQRAPAPQVVEEATRAATRAATTRGVAVGGTRTEVAATKIAIRATSAAATAPSTIRSAGIEAAAAVAATMVVVVVDATRAIGTRNHTMTTGAASKVVAASQGVAGGQLQPLIEAMLEAAIGSLRWISRGGAGATGAGPAAGGPAVVVVVQLAVRLQRTLVLLWMWIYEMSGRYGC